MYTLSIHMVVAERESRRVEMEGGLAELGAGAGIGRPQWRKGDTKSR